MCPQNNGKFFAYIVEAKNKTSSHSQSKKQLRNRLEQELCSMMEYEFEEIKKGVFAKIKFA